MLKQNRSLSQESSPVRELRFYAQELAWKRPSTNENAVDELRYQALPPRQIHNSTLGCLLCSSTKGLICVTVSK